MSEPTNPIYVLLISGFGAFAGAFFAFIFLKLADFLIRIHQRKMKHYNSLVLLETQLNELLGIIYDNVSIISSFKEIINSGKIHFGKLRQVPIDRSHYSNLQDVTLKNNLFSYNYKLRQLNDDIDNITNGYNDIKNALLQKNISYEDYLTNVKFTVGFLIKLGKYLKNINEQTIELLVKVRLMCKKDLPLGTKISRWFIRQSGSNLIESDLDEEKKKLLNEIEIIGNQSQKEIDDILGE